MKTIIKALHNANIRTFQERYFSSAKHEAQEALRGRTHYADNSTLKYFHSRITSARPIMEGLFFEIMESSSRDMHNTQRGFRVVVFDVFGETVYRPTLDGMKATSAAAQKAYKVAFTIDAAAHYSVKLKAKAERMAREATEMRLAAVELV